ncbi:TIGR04283 family arsenosugar biosynthesis glycosyltransferase [Cobetia sp. L2A1]|uniref:TIGR04283 family arsenosugar biosynthesis glycosyltransferase n=1 Tax=Cobetia sp. L2A1 TaxID=2686360 RepID=UPI00131E6CBD|nr:TIGR04283 family arsenosugar biosynthesis glycosyltransferase [Cobetia sp. L2A1]
MTQQTPSRLSPATTSSTNEGRFPTRAPWLSIIMPVHNEAKGIVSALVALSRLRAGGDCEVIVVDGGSTDNTRSMATALCDACLSSEPGRAVQMNAGAARARGQWLLFLHADTRLPDNALALLASAVDTHRRCDWGRFDVAIEGESVWLPMIARMMNLRSRLTSISTGDQGQFVRRSTFEAIGGFADMPLMEDIWLSTQLKRLTSPLNIEVQVHTSGRRWETQGILRTIIKMWGLRLAAWCGVSPVTLARIYGYRAAALASDQQQLPHA